MIMVQNLTKSYGKKPAVNDISFTVEEGEILGFLGPNGAGKSTTMNILTGYLSSSSGKVLIDGHDILEQPNEAKACIGYLPEQPPLYVDMTVKDYLNFMYDLKKIKLPRAQHIQDVCKLVKIDNVFSRIIKNLSKGYKQRVGLAQALLGNPKVLVLDEPTVGLDPKQIIEIRNLIKGLGRRHTIILSSHILSEVQATCDRVIVINDGVVVADDTADHLTKKFSKDNHSTVRVEGAEDEILRALRGVNGVKKVQMLGSHEQGTYDFSIEPDGEADIRRGIFRAMADNNLPLLVLHGSETSLEDIFLQLTSGKRNVGGGTV